MPTISVFKFLKIIKYIPTISYILFFGIFLESSKCFESFLYFIYFILYLKCTTKNTLEQAYNILIIKPDYILLCKYQQEKL